MEIGLHSSEIVITPTGAADLPALRIPVTVQVARNAGVAGLAVAYGAHPAAALDAVAPLARWQEVAEMAAWLRTHA